MADVGNGGDVLGGSSLEVKDNKFVLPEVLLDKLKALSNALVIKVEGKQMDCKVDVWKQFILCTLGNPREGKGIKTVTYYPGDFNALNGCHFQRSEKGGGNAMPMSVAEITEFVQMLQTYEVLSAKQDPKVEEEVGEVRDDISRVY